MTPVVSVLLPVHNGMPWLPEAIESLRAQTFTDFRIVVIDDGSTDGTAAYLRSRPEPTIHLEERRGLTRVLVIGCAWALTPLIARLDADDLAHPERLEQQAAFMDAHPEVGLLGTGAIERAPDGRALRLVTPPTGDADLRAALIRRNPFVHSSVMFRRAIVQRLGGYDPRYRVAQDYDLWMRMAQVTRLACLPDVLVERRILSTGVSATQARARRWAEARIRLRAIARGQYPVTALRHVLRPLIGLTLPPRVVRPAPLIREETA